MQLLKANEAWYLIVFYTLATGGFVLALFNEVGERTNDSLVSTLANGAAAAIDTHTSWSSLGAWNCLSILGSRVLTIRTHIL